MTALIRGKRSLRTLGVGLSLMSLTDERTGQGEPIVILQRVCVALVFVSMVASGNSSTAWASYESASATRTSSTLEFSKNAKADASETPSPSTCLTGEIAHSDRVDIDNAMDQLFAIKPRREDSSIGDRHFHVDFKKVTEKGRSVLNYMFDYRAFGPSTEGVNLILRENEKSKSLDAQLYNEQLEFDNKYLQIASNIMQLGTGLGMEDTDRGRKLVKSSLDNLRELVDEDQINQILATLQKYSKTASFPKAALNSNNLFDMREREKTIAQIVESASSSDALILQVKKDLHKYNRHGKLAMHTVGLAQAVLGVASFTPTLAAPVSETAYFVLKMATGGPEQDKLLRELYLSKRIDSRLRVISEKAQMAIDSYHIAVLSENPVLLGCTQSMVRQMSGAEAARQLFGAGDSLQMEASLLVNRKNTVIP